MLAGVLAEGAWRLAYTTPHDGCRQSRTLCEAAHHLPRCPCQTPIADCRSIARPPVRLDAARRAMSWLGGLSPTVVTALMPIAVKSGSKFLAATIPLVAAAAISVLAALALLWYAPSVNRLGKTQQHGAASSEASAAEGGAPHSCAHVHAAS